MTWKPVDFWHLSAGYSFLDISADPESDSLDTLSEDYERFSPDYQVQLRSYLDLPFDLSLDTMVYLVDEVPHWDISDYARLDLRLGWDTSEDWSLSVTAMNVLKSKHLEFGDPSGINASEVPRSIFGKVTWRF